MARNVCMPTFIFVVKLLNNLSWISILSFMLLQYYRRIPIYHQVMKYKKWNMAGRIRDLLSVDAQPLCNSIRWKNL